MNILPEQEKRAVCTEYRLRLVTVALLFLMAAMLIGTILLLPSYLLSTSKQEIQAQRLTELRRSVQGEKDESIEEVLRTTEQYLEVLSVEKDAPAFSNWVSQSLAQKPAEVSITGFSIQRRAEAISLQVTGVAATRGDLQNFARQMRTVELFDTVVLPVENLAEDRNIEFALSISQNLTQ